jgi:hypothetical protein
VSALEKLRIGRRERISPPAITRNEALGETDYVDGTASRLGNGVNGK